jgi:hypothetical protein
MGKNFQVMAFALRNVIVILSVFLSTSLTALAAPQENGGSFSAAVPFDIPAQPLERALDAYASKTGMAALVDRELVEGRRSSSVKGTLAPDQALRILLAGTNLSARYASSSAFTLEPADEPVISKPATNARPTDFGSIRQVYFAELQEALADAFCRRPESRPGRYRLGLQLWIAGNGTISASHLLSSTGDEQRDAAIAELLDQVRVAPPPPDLPQPVTVVLLTRPAERAPDCRESGRRPQ